MKHSWNFSPEIRLLLATAGTGMNEALAAQTKALLEGPIDLQRVQSLAKRHGTEPRLYDHLRQLAHPSVPETVHRTLHEHCQSVVALNLFRMGELIRLGDAFRDEAIRFLPFKGPTLAALAYGDLALRPFNDLDIWVCPQDMERAIQVASSLGYVPYYELTASQQRSFIEKGYVFPMRSAGNLIDLHTRLTRKAYHFPLDFEEAWPRRQQVTVAGRDQETFDSEDLYLYLAAHGARHTWSCLGWICDCAQLLQRENQIDWDRLLKRSREMRCFRMTALSARLAEELLEVQLPDSLRKACRSDRAVDALAAWNREFLFDSEMEPTPWEAAWFYVRSRERFSDAGRFLLAKVFSSTAVDWQLVRLPRWLGWVYPLLRTIRVAAESWLSLSRHLFKTHGNAKADSTTESQ